MKLIHVETDLLNTQETQKELKRIREYVHYLQKVVGVGGYGALEGSINLPTDKKIYESVLGIAKKYKKKELKYVFVIGIGGSNLGAKAIYDALYGYSDMFYPERHPKLLFLDTCDPEHIGEIVKYACDKKLSPQEICVNIISKSGKTTETIVNFEALFGGWCQKNKDSLFERTVVTTDKGSALWVEGEKKGCDLLEIPALVGGRYSVLSPVGLFPLLLAGIDIDGFRKGAAQIRGLCLNTDPEINPALFSALFLYLHYKKNKTIHDTFIFHTELESLGKWYRQLMGESIGKDGLGITPLASIGSNDLHSVVQLYWGGLQDKTTCFVSAQSKNTIAVPKESGLGLIKHIENRSLAEIMDIIQLGTMKPYADKKIPFFEVRLNGLDEFSIGEFMQYKMIEMMFLGKLFGVNSFDQPQVEFYKIETKRILAEQS